MANFTLKGTLPAALVGEFIQVLRDFDIKHPGEGFSVLLAFEVPELTVKQVEIMFGRAGVPFAGMKQGEEV
jgi:hypothetical protein